MGAARTIGEAHAEHVGHGGGDAGSVAKSKLVTLQGGGQSAGPSPKEWGADFVRLLIAACKGGAAGLARETDLSETTWRRFADLDDEKAGRLPAWVFPLLPRSAMDRAIAMLQGLARRKDIDALPPQERPRTPDYELTGLLIAAGNLGAALRVSVVANDGEPSDREKTRLNSLAYDLVTAALRVEAALHPETVRHTCGACGRETFGPSCHHCGMATMTTTETR